MPQVERCGSVHEVAGWPPHRIPCQMFVAPGMAFERYNHDGLHCGETVKPRRVWFWGMWRPVLPLPPFSLPQMRDTGLDGRTPHHLFMGQSWMRLPALREVWRIACTIGRLPTLEREMSR